MLDKYKEVGGILAAARKEKNKTVAAASESTRIMVRYIEAVETGRPENLPAPEYFMLFARSYAEYLGIDTAVFDEIEERVRAEAAAPDPRGRPAPPEPKPPKEPRRGRKFVAFIIVVFCLIVIAVAAYLAYTQWWEPSRRGQSGAKRSALAVSQKDRRSAEDVSATDIAIPEQPYRPPGKLKLRMMAIRDIWAMVIRDGDTVFNQKLAIGTEQSWEADYRYRLTLTNALAVDLYLNDHKMLPLADKDQTVTDVEINQANFGKYLAQVSDSLALPVPNFQDTSFGAPTGAGFDTGGISEGARSPAQSGAAGAEADDGD